MPEELCGTRSQYGECGLPVHPGYFHAVRVNDEQFGPWYAWTTIACGFMTDAELKQLEIPVVS